MRAKTRASISVNKLLKTVYILCQSHLLITSSFAIQTNDVTATSVTADKNTTNREFETSGDGGLVFSVPTSIATRQRPDDDPETRLDIVEKAKNNEISAEMITNKTRAMISCETGEILVKLNFTEPFKGVAYADFDRNSPCKFNGEGGRFYEMKLPLKGCGTRQEATRLFVNNVVIRFHRSLELEEDEVKTIVCRYPPALAPPPPPAPGLPAKIIDSPPEAAKLTQYEPFVIIAGLLFFALLLTGVGTTSYLTKQQTTKPILMPLPITSKTEFDSYLDKQTIVETQQLDTQQKVAPYPKISSHIVDQVFITNIHEIETVEDYVHHKHKLEPSRRLETQRLDDAYITQHDELTDEETLTHRKITQIQQPKIELRTIEDTFITNVDELVENENILEGNANLCYSEEQQLDEYYVYEDSKTYHESKPPR